MFSVFPNSEKEVRKGAVASVTHKQIERRLSLDGEDRKQKLRGAALSTLVNTQTTSLLL